jgi:energy-coupling factor transport system ATP-binding protein
MVFQRPQDQIVATTVEEDAAFGPGNLGLPPSEIQRRVKDALEVTGLENHRERPSYMLSAGETQRLALAGVLAMKPSCIIFDETTAMLDPLGREMVMQQAKFLQQQGLTIVFITHLMEEAAKADRVIVLHHGELALEGSPSTVFSNEKKLKSLGLDLPETTQMANELNLLLPQISLGELSENRLYESIPKFTHRLSNPPIQSNVRETAADVIRVEELSHTYMRGTLFAHQSLDKVDFTVNQGCAQGLMGSTGSGKSTLLQHINALIRPQSGRVNVLGEDLGAEDLDTKNLRSRVGLVFQQPENQIFEQYVGDEIAFAARNFKVEGRLSDIVRMAMDAVGLDFETFKDRFTSTLSGGEQRKVALASVLAGNPAILLLDEPLAGLDPRSRRDVSVYLQALKERGLTLVISTHQFEDLLAILDGISALSRGTNATNGDPWVVFNRMEELEKIGIRPPLSIRTANAFRSKGWPIPLEAITSDQLIGTVETILQGVVG